MLRKSLIVAAAFGFASSANAATVTGPYAGVAVTVDSVNADLGFIDSIGATGVGGSIFAGYNIASGNGIFFGPEVNIDLNTAEAKLDDGFDEVRVKARWGYSIGARVGTDLSDSTAAYVRAGWARNQVKGEVNGFSDKAWGDGVRFGGGIETAVSGSTKLRLEYNYVNYEAGLSNQQGALGLVFGF